MPRKRSPPPVEIDLRDIPDTTLILFVENAGLYSTYKLLINPSSNGHPQITMQDITLCPLTGDQFREVWESTHPQAGTAFLRATYQGKGKPSTEMIAKAAAHIYHEERRKGSYNDFL